MSSRRTYCFLVAAAALFGGACAREEDAPKEQAAAKEAMAVLPDSQQLFVVHLSPTRDFLVGSAGERVWGASLAGERPTVKWTLPAPGAIQRVAAGNLGEGIRIILAFGRGRGRLDAPLTLDAVDPESGEASRIRQWESPRADFTHLSVVNGELVYAAYDSKYTVREWRGTNAGPPERMATSRAFADLDGDGKTDRVVGRIYGDTVGAPGDLRIELANGRVHELPVLGGVRALAIADTRIDDVPTLYFADGWSARYAREGRALLQRARYIDGAFEVEPVVESHDEYTFNRIAPVGLPGEEDLLLYGSTRVSWLFRDQSGAVGLREMKGRAVDGFGELARHGDRVWMLEAGSPTVIEEAPPLR